MFVLKHQIFRIQPQVKFTWGNAAFVRKFDQDCASVRRLAEDFADKVGTENVVSIAEHLAPNFTVVVWYRVPGVAGVEPDPLDAEFESPSYRRSATPKSIGI